MQGHATPLGRFLFILSLTFAVAAQHDHGHPHHGEVKSKWDEEEYLKLNPLTPPSYWSEDTRMRMSPDGVLPARYPWLMVLHVLFMSGAFFIALPAGEMFDPATYYPARPREPRFARGTLIGSPFPTPTIRSDSPPVHDPWKHSRADYSCSSALQPSRHRFEIRQVIFPCAQRRCVLRPSCPWS